MTHPTLRRLNLEWHELATQQVPSGWATQPALANSVCLGEVLASVRLHPDDVLGALLRVADASAHRVVLQAMLGWAVRAAARDRTLDLDDYLGELWLQIATYPLERRPSSIAANLSLDTRKRLWTRGRADAVDPAELASLPQPEAGPRATLVLARARRTSLIDLDSERALRLVYTDGLESADAAAVLGVSPAALRQRCHRAVRRLAAYASDLGESVC